jgi:copper homeostasis protein (lipoprotein)
MALVAFASCTRSTEAPPAARPMRGMFVYVADAAAFDDCATGRRYPVAPGPGAGDAERAYLAARSQPGEPVLVTFVGRIEPRPPEAGAVPREHAIIERFEKAWPGEVCGAQSPGSRLNPSPYQ